MSTPLTSTMEALNRQACVRKPQVSIAGACTFTNASAAIIDRLRAGDGERVPHSSRILR